MMTLRWKLTWQIAALIVSLLLIGTAALWGLNGLNQNFGVALEGYERLRKVYEVGLHVQAARTLMSVAHPEPARARFELEQARKKFDDDFPPAEIAPSDADLRQAVRGALDAAIHSGNSPDDLDASSVSAVLQPLVQMDLLNHRLIESAQTQARSKRELTMYWMAGLSAGVALLALAIGVAQYYSVMAPLRRLKLAVDRFAKGNFEQRVAASGPLEFAELARNFNRMAEELDGLYRDLQQKVDAKSKELVRNERLASVGFLAAGVAHEINNPLGIITGHAELSMEMLKRGQQMSPGELGQSLEVICEEAFRCKQIVEKLLSLAEAPQEEPEIFSLGELAREMVGTVQALPEYKNRKLIVAAAADADRVSGRRGEIKQVVLNLLFNAMEATPSGGEVAVSVSAVNGAVELSVSDNGRGMNQEMVDRVFEPFYTDARGKAIGGDARRGTGLGLSITHAIVQRHAGSIHAQSDGSGKGSRFVVTLPAANQPGDAGA